MLEAFMQRLAKEMEVDLDALAGATPGVYSVPVDESSSIKIIDTQTGFLFETVIAPCPHKNTEVFFTEALLGNLMGQGTGGAVLGLSDDGKSLVLSRFIENDVDYKAFKDMLEDFLNAVNLWRSEVEEYEQDQQE